MNPKEIAERIRLSLVEGHWPATYTPDVELLERVVASLNLTVAPPKVDRSVRVLVAVSVEPSKSVSGRLIVGVDGVVDDYADDEDRADMMQAISSESDTNRCFAVIDVPPVVPIPTVTGEVRS